MDTPLADFVSPLRDCVSVCVTVCLDPVPVDVNLCVPGVSGHVWGGVTLCVCVCVCVRACAPECVSNNPCSSPSSPRPWELCGSLTSRGPPAAGFLPTPPQRRPPALATLTLGSGTKLMSELS